MVIFDNTALAFVELEMKQAGIVNWGTELDNPGFSELARAVGLFGARVENANELEGALSEAFAHPGAAVVEVRTARHELAIPLLTRKEVEGFALFAARTLISGDGEGLIELARTNLRELEIE